jgi:hypothetical protein
LSPIPPTSNETPTLTPLSLTLAFGTSHGFADEHDVMNVLTTIRHPSVGRRRTPLIAFPLLG